MSSVSSSIQLSSSSSSLAHSCASHALQAGNREACAGCFWTKNSGKPLLICAACLPHDHLACCSSLASPECHDGGGRSLCQGTPWLNALLKPQHEGGLPACQLNAKLYRDSGICKHVGYVGCVGYVGLILHKKFFHHIKIVYILLLHLACLVVHALLS